LEKVALTLVEKQRRLELLLLLLPLVVEPPLDLLPLLPLAVAVEPQLLPLELLPLLPLLPLAVEPPHPDQ
jgi:hypothetical protein